MKYKVILFLKFIFELLCRFVYFNVSGNNLVILVKNGREKKLRFAPRGLKIFMAGSDNLIKLHYPYSFRKSKMVVNGAGNLIEIGGDCRVFNSELSLGLNKKNQIIRIGEKTYMSGDFIICNNNNDKIVIGSNCLFSDNIHIRTGDGHSIFSLSDDSVLNKSGHSNIGDNVWICRNVLILKGVKIPSHSIVGAGSVVTKSFEEENTVIAGNPAKIVKREIYWNIKSVDEFL